MFYSSLWLLLGLYTIIEVDEDDCQPFLLGFIGCSRLGIKNKRKEESEVTPSLSSFPIVLILSPIVIIFWVLFFLVSWFVSDIIWYHVSYLRELANNKVTKNSTPLIIWNKNMLKFEHRTINKWGYLKKGKILGVTKFKSKHITTLSN